MSKHFLLAINTGSSLFFRNVCLKYDIVWRSTHVMMFKIKINYMRFVYFFFCVMTAELKL